MFEGGGYWGFEFLSLGRRGLGFGFLVVEVIEVGEERILCVGCGGLEGLVVEFFKGR